MSNTIPSKSESEVLVKVEGLSKKFCKDLKTSLWYGVKDLLSGMGGNKNDRELRPKEFWAVKDVSFELRRGECLGLIGHNGAGKSTLLKILNGLINPDAGKVTIKGRVGALIELGAGFNPILSGRENIYNNGAVLGFSRKEITEKLDDIIAFAELEEFIDMPVQNYSSGMKVRLGFAVAAQMEPDVLIIDEVLAVGDVAFRMKCYNRILELIDRTAVIFVSHSLGQILRVCSKAMTMDIGQIVYNGGLEKAVTVYEKLYLNKKIGDLKIVEKTSGSFIKNVSLFDKNEKPETDFSTGEDVFVKIQLYSEEPIYKTRLRVCIESINIGPLGAFSSPFSEVYFDLKEKEQKEVVVSIKDLPLQIGSYNIIVGWYGDDDNPVIDIKNFGTHLNVVSPEVKMLAYGTDGFFRFKHEWIKK
ncbi:polysaccharide ABC transporter ATP-binding protein [Tamlana crocina]|uniref:ATP-binding cassette domain-containing protein n=1 Tax=Tamlana crocina TaxID=393006 RepID=A0ABX1DAF9_9FLAO|nr:polysaccharide ABC transporter ATP-binding protein [Tamlana crocina]NJX15027.1 ATP-binding cassette domain-containing protein [Tamlana crocina]